MTQIISPESQNTKKQSSAQDTSMQECLTNYLECAQICNTTLNHCLSMGGKHVESSHLKTLIACADICALSAQWMGREIQFHSDLCRICAEVCNACAQSCGSFGPDDEAMQACVKVCRTCADSCSKMASH